MSLFGLASAGLSILGQMDDYAMSSAKAKVQKQMQAYSNKMARLSDAMNQNAITTNVTLAIQRSAMESESIQRQGRAAVGSVISQAGATGTTGASVTLAKQAVQAAEAGAQYQRELALRDTFIATDQQRRASTFAADLQQDYSPIEKPSATKAFVGMLATAAGAYASYAPSSSSSVAKLNTGNYLSDTGKASSSEGMFSKSGFNDTLNRAPVF